MTQPIETCRRLKSNLEDAQTRLSDFAAVVTEIENDPFVEHPSSEIMQALEKVRSAMVSIAGATEIVNRFGAKLGIPEAGPRPVAALVVDASAESAEGKT